MNAPTLTVKDRDEQTQSARSRTDSDLTIDLLAILNRRKGVIFGAALIGFLVAAAYFLLMPPTYQSTAEVMLLQDDSAAMISQIDNGERTITEDLLATHMSLVQSPVLVRKAVAANDDQLASLESIQSQLKVDQTPASYVMENLYVTRGGEGAARDARVLSISFRHGNATDSQLVAQAILDAYKDYVATKFRNVDSEKELPLIRDAKDNLLAEIERLSEEYRAFRNRAPMLASTAGGANVAAMRYEEISAELSRLEIAIDEARSRLALVQTSLKELDAAGATDLEKLALIDERNAERLGILVGVERGEAQTAAFQALQPERMAGAQTEYSTLLMLKSQLRQAMKDYGAKHPEVAALQMQVDEMAAFLGERAEALGVEEDKNVLTPADVMRAYVSLLKNDLRGLETQKSNLDLQAKNAETEARKIVDFELQNEEMLRELALQEDLYNSIVSRLRDLSLQENTNPLQFEVIGEPEVGIKVSPSPTIAAAIAVLTTLLLAGAAVLVSEVTDQRVHSASDLEQIYSSKVLGHVPDFEQDAEARIVMKKVVKSGTAVSPTIFALHDPKSRFTEAFRGLRTQLLFGLNGTKRVLAITSASQGDGKSTVTCNLAALFAKTGKSTLLIDVDMRRPNVHKLLGLTNDVGLVDVLTSGAEVVDVCQPGPVEGLQVITTGSIPDDPAELLSQQSFHNLIESLREKFDYVILDCPPVLPVSDPTIVAPLVDKVLVVSDLSGNALVKARQCHRALSAVNADLAGIVVNRVSATRSDYNYGDYGYELAYNRKYYKESVTS